MSTKKDFNIIGMIIYFITITIIMWLLCVLFYFKPYSDIDIKLIGTLGIIIFGIGVFQLVSNKIEIGFIYGRVWGAILIATCILLLAPIAALDINEMVTTVYSGDSKEIFNVKRLILDEEESILSEVKEKYEFARYDNLVNGLNKVEKPGAIFYYDNVKSKESVDIAYETLNNYHQELSKLFNIKDDIDTDIVILEKLSTAEMYSESVGGFLNLINNKIYLLSKHSLEYLSEEEIEEYKKYYGFVPEIDTTFESVLVHEYTHKLTRDLLKGNDIDPITLPTWFYEGIAEYSEKSYSNKDIPLKTGRLSDITDDRNYSGVNAVAYYDRAGIFINYMINTYGDDIIVRLVENMDKDTNIYDSLVNVTGKNFNDLVENIYSK